MARLGRRRGLAKLWIAALHLLCLGKNVEGQLDITALHSSLISPSSTGIQSSHEDISTNPLQASLPAPLTSDEQGNQYLTSEAVHLSSSMTAQGSQDGEQQMHPTTIYNDRSISTLLNSDSEFSKDPINNNSAWGLGTTEVHSVDFSKSYETHRSTMMLRNESLFPPLPVLHGLSLDAFNSSRQHTKIDTSVNPLPTSSSGRIIGSTSRGTLRTSYQDYSSIRNRSLPNNTNQNVSTPRNGDALSSASKESSTKPFFASGTFRGSKEPLNSFIVISSTEMSTSQTARGASQEHPRFSETTTSSGNPGRGKRFMLTLKAKSCPQGLKRSFEKQLQKVNSSYGSKNTSIKERPFFLMECNSQITINITAAGSSILDDIHSSSRRGSANNISVDIFNRAFYISSIEKEDYEAIDNTTSNSSSITKVSRHEFSAYVTVGASFGLVLVICISVCCAKLCLKRSIKTLGVSRSSQIQLRFEDYTLTPIPRPSSLRVDYYRGSLTGDLYSTTSAGSIASTPTVESGVIQPFDTSIIPLEDSVAVVEEVSRRASVESATNVLNAKAPTLNNNCKMESKERLPARQNKPGEIGNGVQNGGLSNPIFQKY